MAGDDQPGSVDMISCGPLEGLGGWGELPETENDAINILSASRVANEKTRHSRRHGEIKHISHSRYNDIAPRTSSFVCDHPFRYWHVCITSIPTHKP